MGEAMIPDLWPILAVISLLAFAVACIVIRKQADIIRELEKRHD